MSLLSLQYRALSESGASYCFSTAGFQESFQREKGLLNLTEDKVEYFIKSGAVQDKTQHLHFQNNHGQCNEPFNLIM